MCGIVGIVNFKSSEEKSDVLRRMIGVLRHRGPDAAALLTKGPCGLAHARLSIIDLKGGDQPIHNEDRSVWIVFNGEIFNYPELRTKLKATGHRFYTKSDTEVLVHLYEERGTDMFESLNGQFAFALWDRHRKIMLLGRDRMGIRPLFYHYKNGRLIFGSEIKALFADPNISRQLDPETLSDIFTCWTPLGSDTPFKDIHQILPGHFAIISKDNMTVKRYWELDFSNSKTPLESEEPSLEEWTETLQNLLYDATRIRLRADVPVGAYLSGGIDSTYISSVVKNNFNNLLRTFSVSFTDERFDETLFQKKAVDSLKTEHQSIQCSEYDIGRVFPKIIWHSEVPMFRTAPAPLYYLSKLVRENNFKVVLTGEGADEIFAGYNIFKEDRIRRFWARDPNSRLRPRLLEKLYPYIFRDNTRNRKFVEGFFRKNLTEVDSPVYSHLLRWQNTSRLKTFFSPEFLNDRSGTEIFINKFLSQVPTDYFIWDSLSKAQYTESRLFLSNYLLSTQGDRMAMANSIEGRYPFLDHRVVELASQIPPRYRLNGLDEKYILKKAAKNTVPKEIIKRPKQPYRAPISQSFFGKQKLNYVDEMLSDHQIKKKGYFDSGKVKRLVNKCKGQKGNLISERENMAMVGILSTQLLDHLFIEEYSKNSQLQTNDIKIIDA